MNVSQSFIATTADAPLQPFTPNPKYTQSVPQFVCVLNGKRYGIVEFEVDLNAHGATDSGYVTLPIGSNPDFSADLFRGTQPGLPIDDNSPVFIELWMGFPASPVSGSLDTAQLTRIFFGIVDLYTARFTANQVTFNLRSLGAPLVDNKITRVSQNETTVQFVQSAAAQFGLKAQPILRPGQHPLTVQEVLGREFIGGSNFAASLYGMKYWDLIIQCALFEDVDAWVDQDTVFFAAPSAISRNTVALEYGRDFSLNDGISGTHAPQYNRNIEVRVHTYQRKTKTVTSISTQSNGAGGTDTTTYSRKVTSTPIFGTPDLITTSTSADGTVTASLTSGSGGAFSGSNSPGSESGKEKYVEFIPNLSPAAATGRALSDWRQISQHEYQLSLVVPITPTLFEKISRTSLLDVSGVPYRFFNDKYYPRQITIHASMSEGAHYRVAAVNHVLPSGGV